jgi:hypothetical protein
VPRPAHVCERRGDQLPQREHAVRALCARGAHTQHTHTRARATRWAGDSADTPWPKQRAIHAHGAVATCSEPHLPPHTSCCAARWAPRQTPRRTCGASGATRRRRALLSVRCCPLLGCAGRTPHAARCGPRPRRRLPPSPRPAPNQPRSHARMHLK